MNFESFLASGRPDPKARRARRRALALALGVHVVLLAGAVVHAGWKVDEVSPPAQAVVMFKPFPAPPPPAGAPKAERRPKLERRMIRAAVLVQPREQPERQEVEREDDRQPSEKPGDPGNGSGGIGPDCEAAACDGPPTTFFVAPNVASGRLAIDPQAERYRVKLPPALSRAGMRLWVLARLCVRTDGQVERVSLLRGADPTLDPLVIATLQTWRYQPYSVNGRPVPFCTNVRYEIATQ
jgi:hypothetical protein